MRAAFGDVTMRRVGQKSIRYGAIAGIAGLAVAGLGTVALAGFQMEYAKIAAQLRE